MREFLERKFQLAEKGTNIRTEILAGFTTFTTMAYIIFLNPQILSAAGMDFRAVMFATIVTSSISCFCMGIIANYPFALAPSMGLNAYFTYTIVLSHGYSWQVGLGACFIAGVVLLILNVIGLRQLLMNSVPSCIRLSVAAGIGIFLAFIGLKNIGIITSHPFTLLQLGDVQNPVVWLACFGIIATAVLKTMKIKGSLLIGIVLIWGFGLISGLTEWEGLISLPPDPSPTLFALDINRALSSDLLVIIASFVFVVIFDSTGTLVALAEQGHFLDSEGKLPRAKRAITNDAIGTIAGSLLGTSTVTTYLESASGISVGGRSGLTSVVVSILFLFALFLTPLADSIPIYATSPALIIIGALMLKQLTRLQWDDPSELIPAFVILISIPLTFSIASGISFGFIIYPFIKALAGKRKEVNLVIWLISASFIILYSL